MPTVKVEYPLPDYGWQDKTLAEIVLNQLGFLNSHRATKIVIVYEDGTEEIIKDKGAKS